MAHQPDHQDTNLQDPFLQNFNKNNDEFSGFEGSSFNQESGFTNAGGDTTALLPGETADQFFGRLGINQPGLFTNNQPDASGANQEVIPFDPNTPPPTSKITLEGDATSLDPNTQGGISSLFQNPNIAGSSFSSERRDRPDNTTPVFTNNQVRAAAIKWGVSDQEARRRLNAGEPMPQTDDGGLPRDTRARANDNPESGNISPTLNTDDDTDDTDPFISPFVPGPPIPKVDVEDRSQVDVPEDPRLSGLIDRFTQGIVDPEERRIMEAQLISQVQEGSSRRRQDLAERQGAAGVFGGAARSGLNDIFGESERGLATGLAGIQTNILNKNLEGKTQALETLFQLQGLSSEEARLQASLATQTSISQGGLDQRGIEAQIAKDLGEGRLDLDTARLQIEAALAKEDDLLARERMAQDFIQFLIGEYRLADDAGKERVLALLMTFGVG